MNLLETYIQDTKSGDLLYDMGQLEVLKLLDNELEALSVKHRTISFFNKKNPINHTMGLYIWGGVGSGKSMLMDCFFSSCKLKNKTRIHFHSFMQDTHKLLYSLRRKEVKDPISEIIKITSKNTTLLCFDELQVTDITDAMLVGRLFEGLLNAGITIVATSNRAPDDLYKDGLNRKLFLPFIMLIKKSLTVHEITTSIDYRQKKLSSETLYYSPINKNSKDSINKLWKHMTKGEAAELNIRVNGRDFILRNYNNGAARVTFKDICEVPLGPGDYLEIANKLRLIIIENIPVLSPSKANEAKRFTILIDTLYESKVKLVCSAEEIPNKLYTEGVGSFEFKRTASRLIEMQSENWGA